MCCTATINRMRRAVFIVFPRRVNAITSTPWFYSHEVPKKIGAEENIVTTSMQVSHVSVPRGHRRDGPNTLVNADEGISLNTC